MPKKKGSPDQPKASTKTEPSKPSIDTLEAKISELEESQRLLEEEVVEKNERLENTEATIARLSKVTQKKPSAKQPVFDHDGVKYRFIYPAMVIGYKKLTADEIIGDPEILAKLIETKSAALEKL